MNWQDTLWAQALPGAKLKWGVVLLHDLRIRTRRSASLYQIKVQEGERPR